MERCFADFDGTVGRGFRPRLVFLTLLRPSVANTGPAGVAGRTIKPPTDLRAGDIAGCEDVSTFDELWETHDFIADLPKVWIFRLDFNDQGRQQDWDGAFVDKTQWQPIKIGEWWEPQGHQYDGIAWYRVEFNVPAAAKGRNLSLSFGVVDESSWVYLNGSRSASMLSVTLDGISALRFRSGMPVKIGESNIFTVRVRDRANYGDIWKSVKLVAAKGNGKP